MAPKIFQLFGETRYANRYWQLLITLMVIFAVSLGFFCTSLTVTLAQSSPAVLDRLPAPPPIPVGAPTSPAETAQPSNFPSLPPPPSPSPNNVAPATPSTTDPPAAIREYTFQAPDSLEISIPIEPASTNVPENDNIAKRRIIRVEVVGDTQKILAQVKQIEPLAFIQVGKGTIHAGVFPDSNAAQQRIQQLQQHGLSATMSTNSLP